MKNADKKTAKKATASKAEKKVKAPKKERKSFGQGRVAWFNGISDRLSKRLAKNAAKIDKEIAKVKDDKDAVKALNAIKASFEQAAKAVKI